MEAFNYLAVLLSIIIGLGITQVLTAAGRLIRHRELVTFYWPPLLWAGCLIVMDVQVWWAMFGLRGVAHWTFVSFLVVLFQTVTLYMMSALVLPELVEHGGVDLRTHYERQHRWFFGFFLATLAISVLKDVVIGGTLPETRNLGFHILLGITCVTAMTIRHSRYHEAIAVAGPLGMAGYIALLFARLH